MNLGYAFNSCNQPPRRAPRDDTYTLPAARLPEVWDKTRSQNRRRSSDKRSTIAALVSSALDRLCADSHGGRPGRGPSRLGPAIAVHRSGLISTLAFSCARRSLASSNSYRLDYSYTWNTCPLHKNSYEYTSTSGDRRFHHRSMVSCTLWVAGETATSTLQCSLVYSALYHITSLYTHFIGRTAEYI